MQVFSKHTIRPAFNEVEARANKLAEQAQEKGLIYGSRITGGYGKDAFSGNTYAVKDVLKANGARFCGKTKVWYFDSIESAEAAIASI